MGLLSSCKEAPVVAVCGLCEDGDSKSRKTVQAALPQILNSAAQHLSGFYSDGRSGQADEELEEPHHEPCRDGVAEDGEAFKKLQASFRDALKWPLKGTMEVLSAPGAAEGAVPEVGLDAAHAAVPARIMQIGLLKSCYPHWGAIDADLQEEEACISPETVEERLYFERLAEASRLAREEERRQELEEEEREREEEAEQAAQSAIWRAKREARERTRQEQEKVSAFLKVNGFSGVSSKRKRLFSVSYPLHLAVEENSAEMVHLLLQAGADPQQRNSQGQTPEALALKRNRNGSSEEVLALLRPGKP